MRGLSRAGCALLYLAAGASGGSLPASSGGLAIREQSATHQGASFAGNAAGADLSAGFWNSAAIGTFQGSYASESHGSLDLPNTAIGEARTSPPIGGVSEVETDRLALVSSSYYAYRLSPHLVLGLAANSPFGLSNEADDPNWVGRLHHRSAKLFTVNINPMASYQVAPGLFVGGGAQIEYADLKFKTAASAAPSASNKVINGDDIGAGFTAGVLWLPRPGTSVGLGFRSSVSHELEGDIFVVDTPGAGRSTIEIGIDTPEIATLSLRQAVSPTARLLGTVEWTNWSRLDIIPAIEKSGDFGGALPTFDFRWHDGWFFALGAEWDRSPALALRAGVAYEISPVRNATERLPQVPDSDRLWLSAGASYKVSEWLSVDLAYSHVFFDDAPIERIPPSAPSPLLVAEANQSADIVSLAIKTKWGAPTPLEPLK
jgi:long-chain fatty acid transport protein